VGENQALSAAEFATDDWKNKILSQSGFVAEGEHMLRVVTDVPRQLGRDATLEVLTVRS
jgi:hypothetical protein